jgi:hypothetical protein
MAEVLTNGTFDSDMSSWVKYGGSSRDMFWYDATGAAHDGGAAKCSHTDNVALTTQRYSMYQDITITNAADIKTATMTAWCQWNDALPAANAEVSKSYLEFIVTLKDPDGNFHYIKNTKRYFGSLTALALMTNEDVKSELQNGGNGTWSIIFAINIYRANITGTWLVGWYDDLSLDIAYYSYGSTTETITLTEATSASMALADSEVETITLSDSGSGTFGSGPGTPVDPEDPDPLVVFSADPVFRYYFGSYEGKVYAEESFYKSDDGASIDSYWDSKETDFAEESIDALDKFKTIYKIRLWYVDISDSVTEVTISVKPDGGATWTAITEDIGGTGDDTSKSKDFYIIKSGNSFKFRIEHDSIDNEFQWSALEVFYTLGGDYFQE